MRKAYGTASRSQGLDHTLITRGDSVGVVAQKRAACINLESATYDWFGLVRMGRTVSIPVVFGCEPPPDQNACVSARRSAHLLATTYNLGVTAWRTHPFIWLSTQRVDGCLGTSKCFSHDVQRDQPRRIAHPPRVRLSGSPRAWSKRNTMAAPLKQS
jgi:hypothetical protein